MKDHLLLARVIVLGLSATALKLANPVAHIHHALLPMATAALRGRLAWHVEARQLVAACATGTTPQTPQSKRIRHAMQPTMNMVLKEHKTPPGCKKSPVLSTELLPATLYQRPPSLFTSLLLNII